MSSTGESKIPDIDIEGWDVQSQSDERVKLLSDERTDKVIVKTVSVSNDDIGTAFHIEYYSGETPYARNRNQKGSIMAKTADEVEDSIRSLVSEQA